MIPLYDAHSHLQDPRLAGDLEKILADLPADGLQRCVVNGTCEADWPRVSVLAKRIPWICPAFGLHPWFARGRTAHWLESLRNFLDQHPNSSVGEIGLDRWMDNPNVADQEAVFVGQLELAAERNLPVTIHCLKAWGHLESVLKQCPLPRGFLLHSFGGSQEMAAALTKLGAWISVSGYFAHGRKAAQREVFRALPLDRLLIETDAPDMLPPDRWKVARLSNEGVEINHPRNIAKIYEFVAQLRGMPVAELAETMQDNFRRFFGC